MAVSRVSDMLGFFTRRSDVVQLADLDQEVIDAFETDPPQNSFFVGMVCPFAMPSPPSGWLYCDGTDTYSRTTYSDLFGRISVTRSGSVTQASYLMSLTSTSNLSAGMGVSGPDVPVGTTISSVDSTTQITMSNQATATSTGNPSFTFLYWGVGSSDSTFKVPDLRGEFIRGWDDGRTADSGRGWAAWQDQDNAPHWHYVFGPNTSSQGNLSSTNYPAGAGWTTVSNDSRYIMSGTGTEPNRGYSQTKGSEARPRNLPMSYGIKF